MQSIRRLFRFLFLIFVTNTSVLAIILLVLFLLPEFWSPPLRNRIELLAQQRAGLQLHITRLKAVGLMPLTFRFESITLSRADGLSGKLDHADVGVDFIFVDHDWTRPRVRVGVILAVPSLTLAEIVDEGEAPPATIEAVQVIDGLAPQFLAVRPQWIDLGFFFSVKNGTFVKEVKTGKIHFKELDLDFRLPSLKAAQWNPYFKAGGRIEWQGDSSSASFPFEILADKVNLNSEKFAYDHIGLKLAGFQFSGKGEHDFITHNDDHAFEILPKDLNEFPPSFLPKGLWQGQFSGQLLVKREWPSEQRIQFQLSSDSIRGELQYKEDDLSIVGQVEGRVNLRGKIEDHLELDDSSFWINLTQAEVGYSNWFKKPKGTNLSLDIVADTLDTKFILRRFVMKLAHIFVETTAVGLTSGQWPIEGKITVPPTHLSGLELIFPALAKQKPAGDIALSVDVAGELKNPENIKTKIKNFVFKQFATSVVWPTDKPVVSGKVRGQIDLTGNMLGAKFLNIDSVAAIDLTATEIQHSSGFKKPANWPLKIDWIANWDGKTAVLLPLNIVSKAGQVQFRGKYVPGQSNDVELKATIVDLNFSKLSELRSIERVILGGILNGKLSLKGKHYSGESLAQAPLAVSGSLDWQGGRLEIDTETLKQRGPVEKALHGGSGPEDPIVPNWPILRNANLLLKAQITSVSGLGLQAGHIDINGQWQNGQWHGQCHVGSIFDGEVKLTRMTLSPTILPMAVEIKGQMSRISLAPLFKWMSPQLANYMQGQMSGPFSVIGDLPLNPPNFQQIKAEAKIKIENGLFKTFEIEKKLADATDALHIPVKFKPSQKPVPFLAQGNFQLLELQTTMQDFIVSTDRRDELRIRGLIQPDFNIQLSGTAALASITATGAIAEANSDGQGRLVLPLQISGSLGSPDFQLTNITAKKMIEKTIQNEADKVGSEIKKQLNKFLGK